MLTLSELTSHHTNLGKLEWIGIRPKRRSDMISLKHAQVNHTGLDGDHYSGSGKRAITLIQLEHISVIVKLLQRQSIDPALLRRNLVVSKINLLALRNSRFKIGTAEFEGTGICAPCSRMEETFGRGGYNAVRGHGGITAKVMKSGRTSLQDAVLPIKPA